MSTDTAFATPPAASPPAATPSVVSRPATSPEPDASGRHRISDAVSRLFRISARAKHDMAQRDPGLRDFSVMLLLSQLVERGPVRSSDLAECLHLDPSQVSRHVATAVRDGFIERRADPDDGRATLLAPTSEGRTRHARFVAMRTRQLELVTADWDRTDVDRFAGLLERFVSGFEQNFARGGTAAPPDPVAPVPAPHSQTSQQEIA